MRNNNVRFTISMPKELQEKVRELGDSENRTINNCINNILINFFKEREEKDNKGE